MRNLNNIIQIIICIATHNYRAREEANNTKYTSTFSSLFNKPMKLQVPVWSQHLERDGNHTFEKTKS